MVTNASRASSNDLGINRNGSAVNPAAFQQHIRQDSNTMTQLLQRDPLAQAILGNDLDELQNFLKERHVQRLEFQKQQEEEMVGNILYFEYLVHSDDILTFHREELVVVGTLEAAIRQKGIDESWEAALEHNPEAIARVVMLYLDMEVNGVPLKAFVDSGAQTTIISKNCAEHWGLLRLLAQRFKDIACGVSQSKILGKIHVAPIKIGNVFYHCSFIVLDSPNMEFHFGLDIQRKHQCMIDLKENGLRVREGEVALPFLQEKDMPSRFLDEVAQSSVQCPEHQK